MFNKKLLKKIKKNSWLQFLIMVATALFSILIAMRSCSYDKKSYEIQVKDICIPNDIHKFKKSKKFKITILNFDNYSKCSGNIECQIELLEKLNVLKSIVPYKMEIYAEKCKKSELNLYSTKDVEKFAISTNSDIVIYGKSELITDTTNLKLSFVTNPQIRNEWSNYNSNNLDIKSISLFNLFDASNSYQDLQDIILWFISQKIYFSGQVNYNRVVRSILKKVTNKDKNLKSMSYVLTGRTYSNDYMQDSALFFFEKAIQIDSINDVAYYFRGLLNLASFKEEEALNDIYISKMFYYSKKTINEEMESEDFQDINKIDTKKISVKVLIEDMIKKMDFALAYSFLLQEAYRPDLTCKLTKHYFIYAINVVSWDEIKKLLNNSDEIESFAKNCNEQ